MKSAYILKITDYSKKPTGDSIFYIVDSKGNKLNFFHWTSIESCKRAFEFNIWNVKGYELQEEIKEQIINKDN